MSLVDVVNLNADASCLPSSKWLRCLQGGEASLLMQMLKHYVCYRRKVNLGPVGAAVKDIAFFNPEAIDYINNHKDIFQLMVRPFAHDSPLLRLPEGFRYNLEKGATCIRNHFENVNDFYLAPEIMVTGEQLQILKAFGVRGVFVHRGRYDLSISRHIPNMPFLVHGVLSTQMLCIPFADIDLEQKRLSALHGVIESRQWCDEVKSKSSSGNLFIWRDGESCLLFPLGLEYEKRIFKGELTAGVERQFLSEISFDVQSNEYKRDGALQYFPLHSMKPWFNEMKLYWYAARVGDVEKALYSLPENHRLFWLLTINSDILSSAEKNSPVIEVSEEVFQVDHDNFLWEGIIPNSEEKQVILTRSERAGEGEDYLAYFESLIQNKMTVNEILKAWKGSNESHLKKAYARIYDEILK